MNEVSELKRKIDYLEDTLACMRGENTSLKAELAQQTTNNRMSSTLQINHALRHMESSEKGCHL